jgi:hypothetical protein
LANSIGAATKYNYFFLTGRDGFVGVECRVGHYLQIVQI